GLAAPRAHFARRRSAAPPLRRAAESARLARAAPADPDAHLSRHHRGGGTAARGEQAALRQQAIQAPLCHAGEPLHTNAPVYGRLCPTSVAGEPFPEAPCGRPKAAQRWASVINVTQSAPRQTHDDCVPAALQHPSSLETARFPGGPFPLAPTPLPA